MKTKYFGIGLLSIISIISCDSIGEYVDYESSWHFNNTPSVYVSDYGGEYITSSSARVKVSLGYPFDDNKIIGSKYIDLDLVYSTNKNLSDAVSYDVFDTENINSDTYIPTDFNVELEGLSKNTTYYYKGVAVLGQDYNGYSSTTVMESEVRSFTTTSSIKVGKVTYTDWDGSVHDATEKMSPVGVFLLGKESIFNMRVDCTGGNWIMKEDYPVGILNQSLIYYPYSQYVADNIEIQTMKYQDNDIMCAQGNVSKDGTSIDFNLKHMMSRVIFHFKIEKGSSVDIMNVNYFTIDNGNKVLPTQGFIDPWKGPEIIILGDYTFKSPLTYYESFDIVKGKTYDLTIYSIPTCSKGNVMMKFYMSDQYVYKLELPLSEYLWESGKTYEYTITFVAPDKLSLSDSVIAEWNNNEKNPIVVGDKNYVE